MTLAEQLRKFIDGAGIFTISYLESKAHIPKYSLNSFLRQGKPLSAGNAAKVAKLLSNYGFQFDEAAAAQSALKIPRKRTKK